MYTDLLSHFSAIQYPCSDKNRFYDLEEVFLLCVCAVEKNAQVILFSYDSFVEESRVVG